MAHLYVKELGVAKRYAPIKKDGTPYKSIPKKKAKEDGAVIGITSRIGKHMDNGYLFNWAGKLGIKAGMDVMFDYVTGVLGLDVNVSDKAEDINTKKAKGAFKEASEAAANRGSEIHDAIDSYLKGGALSDDPVIQNAQEQATAWIASHGMTDLNAEHCVLFKGGLTLEDGRVLNMANGATADLITRKIIVDWKTVEKSGGKYYTGKPEHCCQLAFVRHAALMDDIVDPDVECWNIYIDRKTGDIVDERCWSWAELDKGLEFVAWCNETDAAYERLEAEMKGE